MMNFNDLTWGKTHGSQPTNDEKSEGNEDIDLEQGGCIVIDTRCSSERESFVDSEAFEDACGSETNLLLFGDERGEISEKAFEDKSYAYSSLNSYFRHVAIIIFSARYFRALRIDWSKED